MPILRGWIRWYPPRTGASDTVTGFLWAGLFGTTRRQRAQGFHTSNSRLRGRFNSIVSQRNSIEARIDHYSVAWNKNLTLTVLFRPTPRSARYVSEGVVQRWSRQS